MVTRTDTQVAMEVVITNFEKGLKISVKQWGQNHLSNGVSSEIRKLSVSDEQSAIQEGTFSDDSETEDSRGRLLFEFLKQIYDLAGRYPALCMLRSCGLMPISWICVAWYPIYRIPTGQTLKSPGCLLSNLPFPFDPHESDMGGSPKISLPVYGMASYKFKGSMWTQNGVSEHQLTHFLTQAADNWLRLLRLIIRIACSLLHMANILGERRSANYWT